MFTREFGRRNVCRQHMHGESLQRALEQQAEVKSAGEVCQRGCDPHRGGVLQRPLQSQRMALPLLTGADAHVVTFLPALLVPQRAHYATGSCIRYYSIYGLRRATGSAIATRTLQWSGSVATGSCAYELFRQAESHVTIVVNLQPTTVYLYSGQKFYC